MAAMLRSQGVATKLICGTVSAADLNHAWNEVYLEGTGWVTVKLYFSGNAWERMDPTFAASGNSNIEQYIGDASNYTGLAGLLINIVLYLQIRQNGCVLFCRVL